jgi:hypothetical protein
VYPPIIVPFLLFPFGELNQKAMGGFGVDENLRVPDADELYSIHASWYHAPKGGAWRFIIKLVIRMKAGLGLISFQSGQTIGLGNPAGITGTLVPVHLSTASGTAPTFLLFSNPFFSPNMPQVIEIFQDLSVVTHAVVVKISDQGAGEICTVGTLGNPGPVFSAVPNLTIPAIGCKRAPTKASITLTIVFRHFPDF